MATGSKRKVAKINKEATRSLIQIIFGIGLLSLSYAVLAVEANNDDAKQYFREGVAAARLGHYQRAVQAFEKARVAGLSSGSLFYNLGSSYYRLGNYQQAKNYFTSLLDHPSLAATSAYNLGLIALKLKNQSEAIKWFRQALASSRPDEVGLQQISKQALHNLTVPALQTTAKIPLSSNKTALWQGLMSIFMGFDDNANLSHDDIDPQPLNPEQPQQDEYIELLFSGSRYLLGDRSNGWQLRTYGILTRYEQQNEGDFTDVGVGLSYHRRWYWYHRFGLFWEKRKFADFHDTLFSATAQSYRDLYEWMRLSFRYRYTDIETEELEAYWGGDRHRLRTRLRFRGMKNTWYISHVYEVNDREDYSAATVDGDIFSSYSAVRNEYKVIAELPVSARNTINLNMSYRKSSYRGDNMEVNPVSRFQRQDNRKRIEAAYEHRMFKKTYVVSGIGHTSNHSNRELSQYNQTIYFVGVRWSL